MGLVACQECKREISSSATVCPQCGAKQSRTSTFTVVVGALFGLVVIAIVLDNLYSQRYVDQQAAKEAERAASAAAAKAAQLAKLRDECGPQRAGVLSKYDAAIKARKYTEAVAAVRPCAEATTDAELVKLVATARISDLRAVIHDKARPAQSRLTALEALKRDFPADYVGSEKLMAALASQAMAAAAAEERKKAARIAAEKRKEGVHIGMSAEDVLASSWGRPEKVNRSTYSWGTHEQWVYSSGNYLNFRNGILESIQN